MSSLVIALDAANEILVNVDPPHDSRPAHVLHGRILRFYASLDELPPPIPDLSLPALQLETARCALHVLHRVQLLLDPLPCDTSNCDAQGPPAIGTRDLTVLRTLLTLLFRWGVNPLLARLTPVWQANPTPNGPSNSLTDLTALSTLLSFLMSTLFPCGVRARPPQTLITTTILNRHVPDLLRASITLAWLPRSLWPNDTLSLHTLRPFVLRLLEFLPLSQVMTDLGAVLSNTPPPPPHVRKLCSSLLTKSLLRPGGVRGLFTAIFGEQDNSDDPQLERYERTAGILMTVPAGLQPEAYFTSIVPRLLELLSHNVPLTYRRGAAFTISRMLESDFLHCSLVSSLVSSTIHFPIIHGSSMDPSQEKQEESHSAAPLPTPTTALSTLTILLLNTDPSPVFITHVLSPVVPALYALIFHLDTMKASDPVLKESVKGLLATWGHVVETQDGVNILWSITQSKRIYWEVDVSGNIRHSTPDTCTNPILFTPGDLGKGEVMEEIILNLYPDPTHFVRYLKSFDRLDMAAELFVRLLEVYYSIGTEQDADPSRSLFFLQMIVQIQTQLVDGSSPINILRKPEHILSFIKHALGSQVVCATSSIPHKTEHRRGLGLEDLKVVNDAEGVWDSDSDDEPGEPSSDQVENDMTSTAINLLLAILEANPELSARNAPVLNEVFSLLEPLASGTRQSTRGLAREARLVMTARLASSSTSWSVPQEREEGPQEIYLKALKLLQDPILPVRAHGLLLLRQLVSSRPRVSTPLTDAALVPAIMSIFMQSVQDDDSYIFLNAVQGLSAMVEAFGKDVLKNLLETYTRNLSASSVGTLSKQEVDAKVRVGEALGQVIRRCGDALGIYADIIVPRLLSVFRSSCVPTVLRASAVSLLTQCIRTSTVSVLRYINELAMSMIDFLQVELVPIVPSLPKDDDGGTAERHNRIETLDSKPTAIDPKLPPLRRAALHFWTSLFYQLTHAVYNGTMVGSLPPILLRRAKITLGYIGSMDEDDIVRVMAREANEAMDQLSKAMVGL